MENHVLIKTRTATEYPKKSKQNISFEEKQEKDSEVAHQHHEKRSITQVFSPH